MCAVKNRLLNNAGKLYSYLIAQNDKKIEKRRMFYAAFFPCILLIVLWLMRLWEWNFHTDLYWMGVYPRTASGLLGILTEPLVHANVKHLISNSVPLFVLA